MEQVVANPSAAMVLDKATTRTSKMLGLSGAALARTIWPLDVLWCNPLTSDGLSAM